MHKMGGQGGKGGREEGRERSIQDRKKDRKEQNMKGGPGGGGVAFKLNREGCIIKIIRDRTQEGVIQEGEEKGNNVKVKGDTELRRAIITR